MQGSSSTPPRIPADVRREAIAAAATATTSSKRSARSNRIRKAASSLQRSSGPIRSLWGRSYSSHDDGIRNPNHSRTHLRRSSSSVEQYASSPLYSTPKHQNATPPSSPPNPLSPYHQHTAASAAAASAAAVRAMATASSDLAVAVAPVTNNRRSGGRGRSCPPITRRIHPPPTLSPPCEETLHQQGDIGNQERQRRCSTTTTVMAERGQTLDDEMCTSNFNGNTDVGVHAPLGILSRRSSAFERFVDTAYIPEDDEADEATSRLFGASAGVRSGSRHDRSGCKTNSTGCVLARDSSERLAKDVKLRFEKLRKISENRKCVDCGGPCADWASVCHGAFVCLNCAGHHRALGLHVAFTRSLTMDRWREESVRRMELGGNKRLLDFVKRAGLSVSPLATVNDKYTHPWLGLYRKYIAALGNGTEPPSLSREALDEALLDTGTLLDDDGEDGSASPFTRFARSVSSCGGISNALVRCSWTGGGFHVASGVISRGRSGMGGAPKWVPDHEAKACMLCCSRFTIVLRRHHCRRCGRVACAFCAPATNTRPIVEWGLTQAVRHCHQCYRSPLLDWTNLPERVTDGAYECSGNNQPSYS